MRIDETSVFERSVPDDLQKLRQQPADASEIHPPWDGYNIAPRQLLPVFQHEHQQQRQNRRLHIVDERTVCRAEQLSGADVRHTVDGVEKAVNQGGQIIDHLAALPQFRTTRSTPSSTSAYPGSCRFRMRVTGIPNRPNRSISAEETSCPAVESAMNALAPTCSVHQLDEATMAMPITPTQIHVPRRTREPQRLPLCQQICKQQHERDRVHKKADAEQTEIIAHLAIERNHDALQNTGQKQQPEIQQNNPFFLIGLRVSYHGTAAFSSPCFLP